MKISHIDVDDVTLCVRTAGEGPAVLLLHQAPVSARTLESRIERWSANFYCIAPDLPGLGESDALKGGLCTVERMADLMLTLLNRLGIESVALYGQHTGALVATEIAVRAPDKVKAVLIGGYPIYTAEECAQRLATYAPALPEPSWDGAHLAWLWWRYREQFIYWPWNTKEPRSRATSAIPSTDFLQAGVAEIAQCHDTYSAIYHAAFDYDAEGALSRLHVPAHFLLDPADSLSLKIELAAAANPALQRWFPAGAEGLEAIEEKILKDAMSAAPPAPLEAVTSLASTRRWRTAWENGEAEFCRVPGDGSGRTTVILPAFPAGRRAALAEIAGAGGAEVLIAEPVQFPNAGDERNWLAGFSRAIIEAAGPSARTDFDLLAAGSSCGLALLLRPLLEDSLSRLVLVDPTERERRGAFDPTPCPSGGHLLRLWDRLRFERLKTPRPEEASPIRVHGRYENLEQLGRAGWDAVSRMDRIPAFDRLVDLADDVLAPAGPSVFRIVTGVDRRDADGIPNGCHVVSGTTGRPLAEALRILSDRA